MSDVPRRCRMDLMVPAEVKIREAILAVEEMGADSRLTDAVVKLAEAKNSVADFVDSPEARRES